MSSYGRSREFTESSIPRSLRTSHRTKAGTWAKIVVVEGKLKYRITEHAVSEIELTPEQPGIVEPDVLHMVEPVGKVRFFLEFFR